MLADLLKQDDIMYSIIPVSGIDNLEAVRDDLMDSPELHTLILLNIGSILDLPSPEWFGDFPQADLSVHIVDSARPQNLSSLFGTGPGSERIVVWDDGGASKLQEERNAWLALENEPEPNSDSDEDSDDDLDPPSDEELAPDSDEDEYHQEAGGRKRRSLGDGDPFVERKGKRRRTRLSRGDREVHTRRIQKHYTAGTWFGQSASGTMYVLATVLERVDNELLWLAILGLTYQYTSSRISRDIYERNHSLYHDEVVRLNPPGPQNAFQANGITTITPDDTSIRATEELRFTLFRHWTLYDAMYHSSYVNSKLGIWKEKGRKRLTGLLAKMGFAQAETQQSYSHMSLAVKNNLVHQLESIAPEYAMTELNYPSFVRARGWKGQGMSAADEVDVLATIMDVAYGYKMEVEIEGGRNGGEWFGGGKVWEGRQASRLTHRKDHERENIPPGDASNRARQKSSTEDGVEVDEPPEGSKQDLPWWQQNFWAAFDALSDWSQLNRALPLCISLHRAIIRQGTSVIDKHLIKTMRSHRVVILSQGPDLALFSNPGPLSRLALWLVDALRDRVGNAPNARGRARKSLPFVVACLNEETETFIVVGIMAAKEFGDVSRNEFGLAFLDAKDRCNARTKHVSFDTSVLEINKGDLNVFLETLCDGPEG